MSKHERVNEKTPNGGDYSEIFYLNARHDVVDEEEATEFTINECRSDGTIINTVYGLMNHSN